MKNDIRHLIESVVGNDLQRAKQAIQMIIANDNTAANKDFLAVMKRKMQNQPNFIELPHSVRGLLVMEDVGITFREDRYYLTEREKTIYDTIITTKKAVDRLQELGIRYCNSTLIYGESGTGKTLFGKYLAYKLKLPFAYVNFADCIGSHLGETGKNISTIFEYIKNNPCVLMLDEFDSIGTKRTKLNNDVGELARITISLMQALDTTDSKTIIIGATNRYDVIDEALKRRFTHKHCFEALQDCEKIELAIRFMDSTKLEYNKQDLICFVEKLSNKQNEIINALIARLAKCFENNTEVMF